MIIFRPKVWFSGPFTFILVDRPLSQRIWFLDRSFSYFCVKLREHLVPGMKEHANICSKSRFFYDLERKQKIFGPKNKNTKIWLFFHPCSLMVPKNEIYFCSTRHIFPHLIICYLKLVSYDSPTCTLSAYINFFHKFQLLTFTS